MIDVLACSRRFYLRGRPSSELMRPPAQVCAGAVVGPLRGALADLDVGALVPGRLAVAEGTRRASVLTPDLARCHVARDTSSRHLAGRCCRPPRGCLLAAGHT